MEDIRNLVEKIEDLLTKIKEVDRQQRRRIRELESAIDSVLPPLVPGSGIIADKE